MTDFQTSKKAQEILFLSPFKETQCSFLPLSSIHFSVFSLVLFQSLREMLNVRTKTM